MEMLISSSGKTCTCPQDSTSDWFANHGIPVLDWKANERHQTKHTDEPKAAIKTTSVSVTAQQRRSLMASMLQRIGPVICVTVNIKLLWLSWVEL